MDINKLLEPLKNCPCGRDHTVGIKDVQIGHGMLEKAAEILIKVQSMAGIKQSISDSDFKSLAKAFKVNINEEFLN